MTDTTVKPEGRKWTKTRIAWSIFKVAFLVLFLFNYFKIIATDGLY